MNTLFVVRRPPASDEFNEAVTAIMGCSLFGQPVSFLLAGPANEILDTPESEAYQQLCSVLEMGLASGYCESSQRSQPLPQGLELLDASGTRDLIKNSKTVLSF